MPGGAASGWLPTHMGRVILVRGVIGRQPPGSIQIHSVRKVVVYQTPSIVVVAPCTSEPPCTSSTIHDLLGTRPCFLLAVPICHHTLGAASHAITAPVRPANTHRGRVREPPGVVGRGRGQLDVARSPVGRRLQRLALDLRITVPLLAAPRLQQAPLPRGVSLLLLTCSRFDHSECSGKATETNSLFHRVEQNNVCINKSSFHFLPQKKPTSPGRKYQSIMSATFSYPKRNFSRVSLI